MWMAAWFALALLGQPTAPQADPPTIKGGLGSCAADFVVVDADHKPVYAATVHVQIRYGAMSVKRMDLEVGTNSDGRARVEGLPNKAKPFVYDITKEGMKGAAEQDVKSACHAAFEVSIK